MNVLFFESEAPKVICNYGALAFFLCSYVHCPLTSNAVASVVKSVLYS